MRNSALVFLLVACGSEYDLNHPIDVNPGDVTECGFSPISGTQLSVYDCNPVFDSTGEGWGPELDAVGFHTTEVLGHPFYQVWYSARPSSTSSDWGLGYAISPDGTDWTAHPDNPLLTSTAGSWDADAMDAIQVVWDASTDQYVLAYQGYNLTTSDWGMGIATSFDGVGWSKLPDRVLDFSTPIGDVTYCWPLGISLTRSGQLTGYVAGMPSGGEVCQIYPTYASSLVDWAPSDQPILRAGPETYDRSGMASAAIVELDDQMYMFYVGFEDWEIFDGYQSSLHHSLALATSTDGLGWTKSPDNPLPVALTADGDVSAVAAQVVGRRIHLWVTDQYEALGRQAVGYYLFEPDIEPHP